MKKTIQLDYSAKILLHKASPIHQALFKGWIALNYCSSFCSSDFPLKLEMLMF